MENQSAEHSPAITAADDKNSWVKPSVSRTRFNEAENAVTGSPDGFSNS